MTQPLLHPPPYTTNVPPLPPLYQFQLPIVVTQLQENRQIYNFCQGLSHNATDLGDHYCREYMCIHPPSPLLYYNVYWDKC